MHSPEQQEWIARNFYFKNGHGEPGDYHELSSSQIREGYMTAIEWGLASLPVPEGFALDPLSPLEHYAKTGKRPEKDMRATKRNDGGGTITDRMGR